MKNKTILLVVAIFFSFTFLSSLSFAQITIDTVFTKLISNTADIDKGYAIFEYCQPNVITDTSKAIKISYTTTANSTLTKNTEITVLQNVSHLEILYGNILINTTCIDNVTLQSYDCSYYNTIIIGNQTIYEMKYIPIANVIFAPNTCYMVRIVTHWNAKLGQNARDWKPSVNISGIVYTQDKWAWWNASWNKCRNITMNESNGAKRVNEPVNNHTQYAGLNITGISISNAINEIRIVNESCNNGGFALPNEIIASDNSTYAEVLFLANATASMNTTYSVYYNSSVTSNPNYQKILLDYDYFATNTTAFWKNATSAYPQWNSTLGVLIPNPTCRSQAYYIHNTTTGLLNLSGDLTSFIDVIPYNLANLYNAGPILYASSYTSGKGYASQFNINHPSLYLRVDKDALGSFGTSTTAPSWTTANESRRIMLKINGTSASHDVNTSAWNNTATANSTGNQYGSWKQNDSWSTLKAGYSGIYANGAGANTLPCIKADNFEVYNGSVNRYNKPLIITIGNEITNIAGTAWNATVNDTITIVEFKNITIVLTRTVKEIITTVERINRNTSLSRTTTNIITLVEYISSIKGVIRTTSDTISSVETISETTSYNRLTQETLTVVERINKSASLSRKLENILNSVERIISIFGYARNSGDILTGYDSITTIKGYIRTQTDITTIIDTRIVAFSATRYTSDTMLISDNINRLFGVGRSLSDILTISDYITRKITATDIIKDYISTTESILKYAYFPRNIYNTISIVENITKLQLRFRNIYDIIIITQRIDMTTTGFSLMNIILSNKDADAFVLFNWTISGGTAPFSYNATLYKTDNLSRVVYSVITTSNSYKFIGLNGSTNYTVVVNATDSTGKTSQLNLTARSEAILVSWEIGIPIGIFAMAFFLIYVAVNLMPKREGLQALFWVSSLFVIYGGIDIMSKIATENGETNIATILNSVNGGYIWIIVLVIAYLIISFLVEQLRALGKIK